MFYDRREFFALVASKNARPDTIQSAHLQEKKTLLIKKIAKWRNTQIEYMPCAAIPVAQAAAMLSAAAKLADEATRAPPSHSANNRLLLDVPPLFLPSDLDEEFRDMLPAQYKLIEKEIRLRLAQAEDCLAEICRLLRLKSNSLTFKKYNFQGQRENTRAHSVIAQLTNKIALAVNRYRAARAALCKLDPNGAWTERLLVLGKDDVRMHGEHENEVDRRQRGNSRRDAARSQRNYTPSWIWVRTRMEDDESEESQLNAGTYNIFLDMVKF